MKDLDNIKTEDFPVPRETTNENITLKNNISSNKEMTTSEEEFEEVDTRTCCQKTFGKMGPGSMRGCIFNLCILSLGTGCLALPQKMGYMSIVASPIVIFVSGAVNYWTLTILGDVARKYKIRKYEDVVSKLFSKQLRNFLSIVMVLNQSGMVILYQVIMYKLLGGVINEFFSLGYANVETFVAESFWSEKSMKFIVCYLITITVLFPLCRLKTVSHMRYASTFGILSLFFANFYSFSRIPLFL